MTPGVLPGAAGDCSSSAPARADPGGMAHQLSNPDLAPTTPAQRTWSTWHIAALWIGMAVCITTYTIAAGMIKQGMSWWQALTTVATATSSSSYP